MNSSHNPDQRGAAPDGLDRDEAPLEGRSTGNCSAYAPTTMRSDAGTRRWLLRLARAALVQAVRNDSIDVESERHPPPEFARQKRGCFVTLTCDGKLRGCIGRLVPDMPLHEAVSHNSKLAATQDPRFSPVRLDELGRVSIEISVLGELRRLAFHSEEELLKQLRPGDHGVVLSVGPRTATLLPQVWDSVRDKREFLGLLARKAEQDLAVWQRPDAIISVYEVEHFSDTQPDPETTH